MEGRALSLTVAQAHSSVDVKSESQKEKIKLCCLSYSL